VAVFNLILIGLAVTLEPLPITGFILVLASEGGKSKGAAFIAGWLVSLVVVVGATVVVTGGKPPKPSTAPSTGVLAAKILLGAILIALAYRQRVRSGRPKKPPTWMTKLDHLSVWVAFSLGILLQPWVLVGAGAAAVTQLHISSVASYVLLMGFCLLCTASILAMELYSVFRPDAAGQRLDGMMQWMTDHRDGAIIGLSLVVGVWLVGDSIYLLAS
jgi:hypothetical protein